MKSKIVETKQGLYPCLMKSINYGFVVLFISDKKGVIVYTDNEFYVGRYGDAWDMTCFETYVGTVELSN